MKVNLQNIVNSAIERGLVEGYCYITEDKFKGTAQDAVSCLYESVITNLSDYITFDSDEKTAAADKHIGFDTSVRGTETLDLHSCDDTDDEEPEQHSKILNLPKFKK